MKHYGKSEEVLNGMLKAFEAGDIPKALAQVFIHRKDDIPCRNWSISNQMITAIHGHTDARGYKQWQEVNRHVKKGEKAEVTFPSLEGKVFEGVISEVSFNIDSASSTYPVSIALSNPSEEIRPGMAVNVALSFAAEEKKAGMVVPVNTVAEDRGGRFVYD